MKVWNNYGSEHSANLVMIGRFKSTEDAEEVKEVLDSIVKAAADDERAGNLDIAEGASRFSDEMLHLLGQLKIHSLSPAELGQFLNDTRYELKNADLMVTTDEVEISAFLKIFIDRGARVEVYSAHNYPQTPDQPKPS